MNSANYTDTAPGIGAIANSDSAYNNSGFWERLWRASGLHAVLFFLVAYLVYGYAPPAGAPSGALIEFYAGHHARILISAVISGLAVLNLMWFAASLRTTLADVGRDGWGAAASASSAAVGALMLALATVTATLAYSSSLSGSLLFISGFHDLAWADVVLSSFPRAMLIMAGTFGLWRAGLFSKKYFAVGLAAVVLVLLGGTAWMSAGFWAPDGAYSRLISPGISLAWVLLASRTLQKQGASVRAQW